MDKYNCLLTVASLGCITALALVFDAELTYVAVGWASGILTSLGFARGKGQVTKNEST